MDHVRIDEGVKRGPRIRPPAKPRRKSVVPACNSKLANLNVTNVIQRYLEDETTAGIAADLGVHRSGLHQWLLRNCEEEWREAQIARALSALEKSKDDLGTAADALSLARAREELRSAQWELERLFSRLYGQKQEVTHTVTPQFSIQLSVTQQGAVQQLPAEVSHLPITVDGQSQVVDGKE